MTGPVVSIIIAAYNRSRELGYAIASVRASTFTNWEMVVVGDACTDDSAACVAAFGDSRITFVNLKDRCGDQSGPNNHGVAISNGRYIAYLNTDDLYLPCHLAACVEALDEGTADLVFAAVAGPSKRTGLTDPSLPMGFELSSMPTAAGYSPDCFFHPSAWMLRRSLAERAGPWPRSADVHYLPSQVWLFRSWRAGASLQFLPRLGVIQIAAKAGDYLGHATEHASFVAWCRSEPRFRERILEEVALRAAVRLEADQVHPPLWPTLRRLMLRPLEWLVLKLGMHPRSVRTLLRLQRGDALIRAHNRRTGAH